MIDQQKRKTLKFMAAIGVVGSSPAAHGAVLMALSDSADLQIGILAGKTIPGVNVILRNTTAEVLRIEAFQPGIIACRGQYSQPVV